MRHRGFRQLVRAWVFTNIADSSLSLMSAAWVKELSGSDGAAAMVFVALGLPALLAPTMGHIADRTSRRRLLAISNLAMMVALTSLLGVSDQTDVWRIYVVVFLYGMMALLTTAAGSGLIKDLLADEELASGNATLQTIDRILQLVAPLAGTVLYASIGPYAVVALAGACFGITALLLSRLRITESEPPPRDTDNTYWSEVSEGFRHILTTAPLKAVTIVLSVTFGVVGMVNASIFAIMDNGLGVRPELIGVLVSVQGIGAICGGLTSAAAIRRFGEKGTVARGSILLAIGLLPLAGTSIELVLFGMVIIGLGVPWIVVAYTTLRQRLTPPSLQGRTAAASSVAFKVPETLSIMAAAAVIGIIDYRIMIAAAVIVTFSCAVSTLRHTVA